MHCYILATVLMGFILDLCFGDPHWLPHPIRLMGNCITLLERSLRAVFSKSQKGQLWAGGLLVLLLVLGSFLVPMGLLALAFRVHPLAAILLHSLMVYQILAARALEKESMAVAACLAKDDLPAARLAVGRIVGRDTTNLDQAAVCRAAVETVAENTADGVIAPLLYTMLGGAPLGFAYKAINTMDSMLGYKNPQYLYFGRVAAKLDDIANFLPARIAALLMVAGAVLLGQNGKNAWRIYRRDRANHASPNSAQTEAACAGALGLQLAGDAYYFGKLLQKPTIGDPLQPITPADIAKANKLMYAAAVLLLFLGAGITAGEMIL